MTEPTRRVHSGLGRAEQIAADIRERIARGELRPGDVIPSERDIVTEYGVAKMTAGRATARLKSEGLVETQIGRGLVVREQRVGMSPAAQFARMYSTGKIRLPNERTQLMMTGHQDAARVDSRILESIGATVQSPSIPYRQRVIFRDEQVMCAATSWWPGVQLSVFPGWPAVRDRLLGYDRIPEGTNMAVAELIGEDPEREDYVTYAEAAGQQDATLLRVAIGSPVLRVMTTMHSASHVIECGVYSYPAGVRVEMPSQEHRC